MLSALVMLYSAVAQSDSYYIIMNSLDVSTFTFTSVKILHSLLWLGCNVLVCFPSVAVGSGWGGRHV